MGLKQKMIGVSEPIYDRLRDKKKGDSFDTYISKMLSFFAETETDPNNTKSIPTLEINKNIERVIKILKAQEKLYKEKFDALSKNVSNDSSLTDEELQSFYSKYEQVIKENSTLKNEVLLLKNKSVNIDRKEFLPSDKKEEILSLIDFLNEKGVWENGYYKVHSNIINSFFDRLKAL